MSQKNGIMSLPFDYKLDNLKSICFQMSSRSNSVKAAKKNLPLSLFLVEFAAHWANVGVTPITLLNIWTGCA